jgi:hypothetical protein
MALLPVIKGMAALGHSEADVGLVIGYTGRNPEKFFKQLCEEVPEAAEAYKVGTQLANTELVTRAWEVANGYKYKETVKEYIFEDELDNDGNPTGRRIKTLVKEKNYNRVRDADSSMLKMLLISRMPEHFTDSKKAPSDFDPIGGYDPTADEIAHFAGEFAKMLKKLSTKKIVSKDVKNE